MPELPDLEVVRQFLQDNVVSTTITEFKVLRPLVLRPLVQGDVAEQVTGKNILSIERRGRLLLIFLSGDLVLVIHPMLAGRLQYCDPKEKLRQNTFVTFTLSNGKHLRYFDDETMGMIYVVEKDNLTSIPRLVSQGLDAFDPALTLDTFKERLRRYHGEIKGILTRGELVAGIGNAYADEILWEAKIYPFRKRKTLSDDEVKVLYEAMGKVFREAIAILQKRVGNNIHVELRDFLNVHRRGKQPCPRCGEPMSDVYAKQKVTSFCRKCQPGLLLDNLHLSKSKTKTRTS